MARTATIKIGRLSTAELVKLRKQIDTRLRNSVSELEAQLHAMRRAIAEGSNGSVRRGRRSRPGSAKGGNGQRALRPTGLPYRALTVIKGSSSPVQVADIASKLKLNAKKKAQLNVALMGLKKRGDIASAGRGLYKSA